jgi:glycosyltransferase involved in cell wall biosynthesis
VLADNRGILVPPDDPESLASAITDVLTGRRRTDLDAARRYAAGFTAERMAEEYAVAYRRLTPHVLRAV